MRVLHVIAGAATGGAETFSQDAIRAMAQRGVSQHVIGRPHPIAVDVYRGAEVGFTPMGFSSLDRHLGGPGRIRREVERFRPDVVHAWMQRAGSFIPAGLPQPVVGWLGGYYQMKNYRTSDILVGVTPEIRNHAIREGFPADRVFVGHTFGTLPDSPPLDRADLATPREATVYLVLSRMHQKKGIDTVLQALAQLPGAYLWLAGDGPEMATYQALCTQLGLDDRVRFLGWRTDRKALLAACDFCVLPSRYEPFGTVIAEAWFMNRPLVASTADGPRQYVTDNHNGFVFEIDRVDQLAERMRTAAGRTDQVAAIVAQGHADFESKFSEAVSVQQLLDAYAAALRLGKRTRADGGPF